MLINDSDPSIFDEYDVFGELGCLPGEYHINIDETVRPVVHPPRRVPFALRHKLKAELKRLVSLNVIEKVDHPTDWVNSIVLVEKSDGSIRICLDPKDLNKAIKREFTQLPTPEEIMSMMAGATRFSKIDASSGYWQIALDKESSNLLAFNMLLPTPEEIMSMMAGATRFSKIDASSGYWQIALDKESSNLLAFNTPFGRYKFKRLPFGVHCASEVFDKRIAKIIDGLLDCAHIQDDILVWDKDKEDYDQNLRAVMDRIQKSGLKLNKSKCAFGLNQLKYCGHIFSDKGVKADPSKIEAITNMPTPESPADLRRFLRMVQYLAKFVPNLASNSSALRQLLVKDANWEWTEEHTKQFQDLQFLVTNSPVLKYFDPNLPVKLSVDASKSGLGSVLLQLHKDDWHPVAFASRALSKTERRYSQIEKETLAVVYASEKFNQFVYGRKFLVESDHKPLQSIFKRNINKAPPRIQRLLLRLQKYDIDLIFSPGSSIPVPDALSRAYLPNTEEDDKSLEYQVHLLVSNLPISEPKLREIQNATENDQVLQKLKKLILDGFPDSKSSMPAELIPYFQVRSELSIAEGLIFKGDKIVIPESLRKEMKERIHIGHMGIERCKARAQQLMYWPNINADITNMVSNCSACLENRRYHQKVLAGLKEIMIFLFRNPVVHIEVNNDSAQHYRQRLRTSVRPPNRYGFKDGQ